MRSRLAKQCLANLRIFQNLYQKKILFELVTLSENMRIDDIDEHYFYNIQTAFERLN